MTVRSDSRKPLVFPLASASGAETVHELFLFTGIESMGSQGEPETVTVRIGYTDYDWCLNGK